MNATRIKATFIKRVKANIITRIIIHVKIRIRAKVKYGYIWRRQLNKERILREARRRELWRQHGSEAVLKPYGVGKGSGWSARYIHNGEVLCYVDKLGGRWF